MKETQTQITRDKEVELRRHQKTKLMGTIRRIKGLELFEYNHKTRSLRRLGIHDQPEKYDLKQKQKIKEVKISPDCFYLQALNLRNALKKLMRNGHPVESYE